MNFGYGNNDFRDRLGLAEVSMELAVIKAHNELAEDIDNDECSN